MQYSKPMIDLVYEIRRRVDTSMKPGIKLANPDMLRELAGFYHTCKDTITRTLIKELLLLAGDSWATYISDSKEGAEASRQTTKTYRGQISLVQSPGTNHSAPATPHKPVRIYRGQIVDH